MAKFGVWAYVHFGDVEAETQAEAQSLAAEIVALAINMGQTMDCQYSQIDVVPEDDAHGVCC